MQITSTLPDSFVEHEAFGRTLSYLSRVPLFKDIHVLLTDRWAYVPVTGNNVIVIQAGNERDEVPPFHASVLAVFKPYMSVDRVKNVFHLPLPCPDGFSGSYELPMGFRDHEMFFSGRSIPSREAAVRAMTNMLTLPPITGGKRFFNFTRDWNTGLPIAEYSNLMSRSRIVLSPRGMSQVECFRFTEAVACGCAIIADKHPPLRVFQACPAIYINDWRDLPKISGSLTMTYLNETRRQMRDCWHKHFSPSAVASFIADTVKALR